MQANSEHVPNPVPRKQVALGLPPAANSMLDREVESLARGGEGTERGFLAGGAEVGGPRTYVLPDPERFNPCVPI